LSTPRASNENREHQLAHERELGRSPGDNRGMTDPVLPSPPPPAQQPRNPLHGLTLEAIVTALVEAYGWQGLDERIPLRCFAFEPSIKSSLKLLRKTPWAREKVEGLYLYLLREQKREEQGRGSW
jgi:hypothetical protein